MEFQPDYQHVLDAAYNRAPRRIPLYEHIISDEVMERVLGVSFRELAAGTRADRREYLRHYVEFFRTMGYDTVSLEKGIGSIMPGSGALGAHKPGVIKDRSDFERYPWADLPTLFFERYQEDLSLLEEVMPAGMKAVGGPGNGVFECVQDVVGFTQLCYIQADDPKLYADLFGAVGETMVAIWQEFLRRYGQTYAVCRFGDDLGFKSSTLISEADIKQHIIPQYARVVQLVHEAGKPFLLHSCGNIFGVMDALLDVARIDAKHSNEDVIAPFSVWVEKYGNRIGNFGGIDTDVLVQQKGDEIADYVGDVYQVAQAAGGVALGSGNSIPNYVPSEGYLAMVEAVRSLRGE